MRRLVCLVLSLAACGGADEVVTDAPMADAPTDAAPPDAVVDAVTPDAVPPDAVPTGIVDVRVFSVQMGWASEQGAAGGRAGDLHRARRQRDRDRAH